MNQSESDGHMAHTSSNIFAAIELSSTVWVIALHLPTKDKISVVRIPSGDVDRLLVILERARATVRLEAAGDPQVHTCYEAGYDGFWLHRLLTTNGINNLVLDSASIQVSRRRRNAKTDRIDAEGLVRVLMALYRGETKAVAL